MCPIMCVHVCGGLPRVIKHQDKGRGWEAVNLPSSPSRALNTWKTSQPSADFTAHGGKTMRKDSPTGLRRYKYIRPTRNVKYLFLRFRNELSPRSLSLCARRRSDTVVWRRSRAGAEEQDDPWMMKRTHHSVGKDFRN